MADVLIDPSQLPEDYSINAAPWSLERAREGTLNVLDAEGAVFATVAPPNSTSLRILEGKIALSQGKTDRLCPQSCRTRSCYALEDYITIYPICQCKLSCIPEIAGKVVAHLAQDESHTDPAILDHIEQNQLRNLRSFPVKALVQELARRLA